MHDLQCVLGKKLVVCSLVILIFCYMTLFQFMCMLFVAVYSTGLSRLTVLHLGFCPGGGKMAIYIFYGGPPILLLRCTIM